MRIFHLCILFMLLTAYDAFADPKPRRKIVVASLGTSPLRDKLSDPEEAVRRMISHWEKELETVLPDRPDLIVLPEACDRYPAMSMEERREYYRCRADRIRDFFKDKARENQCYIAYSAARLMADGTYRNSTQLIGRDGEIVGIYDKNYPTVGEISDGGIVPGNHAPVFDTDFGRVAMVICFDLNFHELLERFAVQRPDLIVFSSMYHGGLMQNYWAYHCRSYFVGAVAGIENNIIDPVGNRVAHSTNYIPRITATVNLDYQVVHLDENWEKLDALKRKYGRGVTIFDPGYLGAVLVTSELPETCSREMIQEFSIELWDEYYQRSAERREKNLEVQL